MTLRHDSKSRRWLATKFLLFSIGVYVTIAGIMGISWLAMRLGIGTLASTFVAFCATVFVRTFYEQIVILDIPKTRIEPGKNALFSLIYAIIMSFVFYVIRPPLGYWGIPVALVIAQAAIKPIKAYLWPSKPRPGLHELYEIKQSSFMASLYGFFCLLAFITITGAKSLHLNFAYAFGAAVFIALVASVLFELHYLYEQKIVVRTMTRWIIIALCLASMSAVACIGAIDLLGVSGKVATITTCCAVKIFEQYLLSRSF